MLTRIIVFWVGFALYASSAFAQWQTPSNTIPYGRGAGVTGFNWSNNLTFNGSTLAVTGAQTLSGALTAGSVTIPSQNTPGCAQFSALGLLTTTGVACSGGGGGGAVVSVGLSMPAIFTVTGSPVTTSGTLTATANGTSGGVPYFNASNTMASSAALTANLPVIGGGAGGAPSVGTRSGNTTAFVTTTGTQTSTMCVNIDASGNHIANTATCPGAGTSGGVPYYNATTTLASSGVLTANLPVIGGGAGSAPSVGTRSGNTTAFVTTTGSQTAWNCAKIDASGNHIANGGPCDYGILWVNLPPYSAVCDGVTDDSAAFQSAINDAIASRFYSVRFLGPCKINSTLVIAAASTMDFGGLGTGVSYLYPAANINAINILTSGPVHIHDMQITYQPVTKADAGTIAIALDSSPSQNSGSSFNNLEINYSYVAIKIATGTLWTISNSIFGNFQAEALILQNTVVADSGDNSVYNNTFNSGAFSANAAVVWNSGGGLRFSDNKTNGSSMGFGVQVALSSGAFTADLFFTGNSFEGISTSGTALWFGRAGATGGLGVVTITGNELSGLRCAYVPFDANGSWLQNVAITGNTCTVYTGGAGIEVHDTDGINITGNTFQALSAGSKKLIIGATVTGCNQIGNSAMTAVAFDPDSLATTCGGFTGTKTVRAAGGASDCTMVFLSGVLISGGSC